jgi:hypothetical protein
MKKYILFVLATIVGTAGIAQKGILKGSLHDADTKQALPDATISVSKAKDSTLLSFTLTSNSGYFEIKNIDTGAYYMQVSYLGFEPIKRSFRIAPDKLIMDLGDINMGRAIKTLQEVVVTDDAPVKIKGDTVEFKGDAFKSVKPNANVEDMLKKIPGMQVDKDGTVKAQGETVQKVYVDGKEFFGNDPKLATKNLSQDMVESIQVYDDMSEQAKFTKIDDGSRQKAINIKLKKDKKNGLFGKATAGYGTNDRYDANVSLHRFNGSQQISFIGAANNVNKQGFSFSDVITSMGGMGAMMNAGNSGGMGGGGGMMGGGQMISTRGGFGGMSALGIGSGASGINKSLSGGLNYRDAWGVKVDASGSLFYSDTRNNTEQDRLRNSFYAKNLPFVTGDSSAIANTDAWSNSLNRNLRFNYRIEWRIDSLNSLLYYPSFTLQHSDGMNYDSTFAMSSLNSSPYYLSQLVQNKTSNNRDGYNINNNLLFRHRFGKVGRTITLGYSNVINHSEGEGYNYSPFKTFYENGALKGSYTRDQRTTQLTKGHNNVLSTSYTEPIGRNKLIELNYSYTNNQSTSDRKGYDLDATSGKYERVADTLTNYFENDYIYHRYGANFRVQQKKYNWQLGVSFQNSELTSRSVRALNSKDTTVKQSFTNFYPTANFTYQFTRNKALRFNYRGRTNQPTISQLQDVPDISSATQIKTGNPGLGQEFIHNFNLNYNTFNMLSFKYFAANLNYSQTNNKIVNSIQTLGNGTQLTRPVNMNGAFTSSAFVTLGIPFRNPKLKGSNFNTNSIALYNRDVSMVNTKTNQTNTLMLSQTVGFNYTYKEKLDVAINGSVSYNNTKYSLTPTNNTDYWSQTYSADVTYQLPKDFILSTDVDYYINSGRAAGYNQSIPMWNASFSKLILNKVAEVKLTITDILNQNQSISRNTGESYFEDVRSNVLRQYFLLSFTYNINRMAGKNMMQLPRTIQRRMDGLRITQ